MTHAEEHCLASAMCFEKLLGPKCEGKRVGGVRRSAFVPVPLRDGAITVDGKTYEHDVIIRLSGAVDKRRKRLSKEEYGTSHIISKAEAKFVFEDGCELLVVGAGQQGNVTLSAEAQAFFEKHDCRVIVEPTPDAIRTFNTAHGKKIALIHVTC